MNKRGIKLISGMVIGCLIFHSYSRLGIATITMLNILIYETARIVLEPSWKFTFRRIIISLISVILITYVCNFIFRNCIHNKIYILSIVQMGSMLFIDYKLKNK